MIETKRLGEMENKKKKERRLSPWVPYFNFTVERLPLHSKQNFCHLAQIRNVCSIKILYIESLVEGKVLHSCIFIDKSQNAIKLKFLTPLLHLIQFITQIV